jgi:hypothetical protein
VRVKFIINETYIYKNLILLYSCIFNKEGRNYERRKKEVGKTGTCGFIEK